MKPFPLLYRSGLAAAGFLSLASWLSAALPRVALEVVSANQLLAPVAVVNAGDGSGRLFIVEQRGQIRIIENGVLLPEPFLDIAGKLVPERPGFDERGLLGLAFHPDYATLDSAGQGKFYVYYSADSPNATDPDDPQHPDPVNHMSVVAEYSVDEAVADLADAGSERILFTQDEPQFNHDGGQLAFGPDGLLYIAFGDGGSANDNDAGHSGGDPSQPSGVLGNGQDRSNLLGSILRIDPLGTGGPGGQYGIPADNPFFGEGGGVREEIYAYGLRNPWRFSFDDGPGGTGQLFCADVGQAKFEEVNIIVSGGNYGWRKREGTFDFDASAPGSGPFIDPVAQYAHPTTEAGLPKIGLSVTGGYVYRGSAIPGLAGRYVFADWSSSFGIPGGTLLGMETTGDFALSVLEVAGGNPVPYYLAALGEDEAGELYLAAKSTLAPSALDPESNQPTGTIFRIVPAATGGAAGTATIEAVKDNTMFSEGNQSNGAGQYCFAGRTAQGQVRRALLAFDIAGKIPAGATIGGAQLAMRMSKTISGASGVSLHRVEKAWGEGGSNAPGDEGAGISAEAGDTTWNFTFFSTDSWETPGGDFVAMPTATASVNGVGGYTWASPALAAEVQVFLDNPAENFGWVLVGDESNLSAKRFDSREATVAANRPQLTIDYTTGQPTNLQRWTSLHFPENEPVDFAGDLDHDRLQALIEYGADLDPNVTNPLGDAYSFQLLSDEDGERLRFRFRRDPRAEDLIYQIEGSGDLLSWTPLVESIAGAAPAGAGVVSDHPIVSAPPLRETIAEIPVTGAGPSYLRLTVTLVR